MNLDKIMESSVACLVEYYDDSAACDRANALTTRVHEILGPSAPVFRVNVKSDAREASLARITEVPTIIIYRNRRREFIMTNPLPSAEVMAERLRASLEAPGAVNPLKGHPRK